MPPLGRGEDDTSPTRMTLQPVHPEVRLSVVMPTLNQAAFIRQAVASIMSQADLDTELLVQDGGSTDGTREILAELAARHPSLRWASEPDSGPADALNRALARARGAIIGWLNSDDLYTPGAAARALAALRQQPGLVMVYGNAEHVDAGGAVIGRYPTRQPAAALATAADGCHICQPSAFFRRELLQTLGGLDTTLRTAFDFEFWLRLLKAYPQRVGFIPAVQAQSRLHAGSITLRLREQVALEGLQVVHRHIGPAPAHWLLTHFDEVVAGLPFDGNEERPNVRLLRLVQRAQPWLSAAALVTLRNTVASHRALQLATAHLFAAVHADGWAPPQLELRVRQPTPPWRALRLHGRHAAPHGGPLQLQAHRDGVPPLQFVLGQPGPFVWSLPLDDVPTGGHATWKLHCATAFVPADVAPASSDTRALAFLIEAVDLQP